ncbi:hypothetical protein ANCCEY_09190 [Ancylostoma ceylanicum]|uniref:Peptidase A1 domain-containing protein n=1 Tax=Ancylostoma ceylanicum TaxID=53326 RepID=A0A0D6LKN3_9BILA|nr:hypothetical protein ANCCEY_09190 [Ancylostoma ceylanicum]
MHLKFLLLLLVGAVTATVYQMPLTKIDSPMIRMMREGIWRDMMKKRNAARLKMRTSARTFIDERQQDVPFDGVLGLAFQAIATNDAVMPPFVHAHELNLVEPIFTVHLRRVGEQIRTGALDKIESESNKNMLCKETLLHSQTPHLRYRVKCSFDNSGSDDGFGGVFTYGGVDTQNCAGNIMYEPLTEAGYWQFKMRSVSIGGFRSSLGWQVVSSTGSAFIGAPKSVADAIALAVNAEVTSHYFKTAFFSVNGRVYNFCWNDSKKVRNNSHENLQDLSNLLSL